ncbi:unnamed protein product [Linum trigynum]|uniref:Uncharacterized protein n=1 Tax=Linum trigynum TaxID=586398 RepID=A0AAV2FVU2_9ROSI
MLTASERCFLSGMLPVSERCTLEGLIHAFRLQARLKYRLRAMHPSGIDSCLPPPSKAKIPPPSDAPFGD